MVQAILAGRKTVTRRVIPESFNGCATHGPHPCPNEPVVLYPGEKIQSPVDDEVMTVDYPQVRAIFHCSTLDAEAKCRFGKVGDVLWVRESWSNATRMISYNRSEGYTKYAADYDEVLRMATKWRPSIHMPKSVCRVWLEVEKITVEELHDITDEEAIKEGIHFDEDSGYWFAGSVAMARTARDCFRELWIAINGKDSWDCNPWVWRTEFKKLSDVGRP